MAKKKSVSAPTAESTGAHVVSYTNDKGEDIVATFATPEHAAVLRSRLKSHGVHHVYKGDEVPEVNNDR